MNRPDREAAGVPGAGAAGRMVLVSDLLLHPRSPAQRPWKYLLPTLVLAFVARAAIALSGDFVLHPDEIMQYLEPAHRLVFGNGAAFWEYLYGARSWLLPGLVAGLLLLFDAVGLGEPAWYVAGVKLVFCAVSLLIPAGMYFFARQHFGEAAARAALLAGAFWYELAAFAHKPMTEFVATALFIALLALCVQPAPDRPRLVWTVALLAVLVAAIRCSTPPWRCSLSGCSFCVPGRSCSSRLRRPRSSSQSACSTRSHGTRACSIRTSSISGSTSFSATCERVKAPPGSFCGGWRLPERV